MRELEVVLENPHLLLNATVLNMWDHRHLISQQLQQKRNHSVVIQD